MTISLRPADISECATLSTLCLRSKGYWGYDEVFLEKCREELTITPDDIAGPLIVAEKDGALAGVAQVGPQDCDADLLLFFVDPPFIGLGIGRMLFDWCEIAARDMGARNLMIDAEPGAEAFYQHMGATRVGERPSGSIPGRLLPLLKYPLPPQV